jgi:hypothetical protein
MTRLTVIQGSRGERDPKSRTHKPLLREITQSPFIALTAETLGIRGAYISMSDMYEAAKRHGYELIQNTDAALEWACDLSKNRERSAVLLASEPIPNGDDFDHPGFHIKCAVSGKEGKTPIVGSRHFSSRTIFVFRCTAGQV